MKRVLILSAISAAFIGGVPTFAQEVTTATDPNAGAYDSLSAGEKSIVDAIYESHVEAAASETTTDATTTEATTAAGGEANGMMTPDDIAAMKENGGWGKAYNDLYAEGKVSYRNLGQAISAHKHSLNPSTAGTGTVVTTGSGQQIVMGGKKSGGTESASDGTKGQAGSNKSGQNKPTLVISGGGSGVSGAASHSNAGGVSGVGGAGGAKGRGYGGGSHK